MIAAAHKYATIQRELAIAEAERNILLREILPTGKAVRDQNAVIKNSRSRLTSQERVVAQALSDRDAADTMVITYLDARIRPLQDKLSRLRDPQGFGYRNNHPEVVSCRSRIEKLKNRQEPYQAGMLRNRRKNNKKGVDLIPFCLNLAFFGSDAGERNLLQLGDIEIPLRWCPAGTFLMGEEDTPVETTLSHGFWMFETLVTQQLWQAVYPQTHRQREQEREDRKRGYCVDLTRPTYCVDFSECAKFGDDLNDALRTAGIISERWRVQLPTEAQWEYACRAGTTTRFHWGDREEDFDSYAWLIRNAHGPRRVGEKFPNPWNLHDMTGLMREWTSDVYVETLAGGIDPTGPNSEFGNRVIHGWGWCGTPRNCASSDRTEYERYKAHQYLGFRLVCNPILD